ncbi:LexA family transcriptional regulator [Campylobacter sp. faydin G-24]|uniref:LexA family transcriptional regulator n=1 Tax=Campylobacter anatolicus TaxID=2829105 RepID=A0ABS5HKC5_9BACT|nr:XRE family transcriptional regulator [Campylobacter anatolicus]MBR8464691.1 LexA family transcriptional regulator [Campylobacter anatolicus]
MKIGQKIRFFREERGLNQKDLANLAGVSEKTIQRYEKANDENLTTNVIKKIAIALNLNVDVLTQNDIKKNVPQSVPQDKIFLSRNDEIMSPNLSDNHKKFVDQSVSQSQNLSVNLSDNPSNLKNSHKQTNIISIPYFEDTYASAGNGVINYDEAPVIMDFDEEFLRMFLRISGNISNMHIINSRGDSMEPTITSGELLFINPMQNESGLISGCIYIINYDGDIFVKRVEKNPVTKAITLFSDNEKYDPIIIEKHNLEHCYIIGRVVSHMKRA